MKKTKRLILLAISAVMAMALVAPAVASAGEWGDGSGEPLIEEVEAVPYAGTVSLGSESSERLKFRIEGTARFEPATHGEILTVDSAEALSQGNHCESTAIGLPWSVEALPGSGKEIKVEDFEMETAASPYCPAINVFGDLIMQAAAPKSLFSGYSVLTLPWGQGAFFSSFSFPGIEVL